MPRGFQLAATLLSDDDQAREFFDRRLPEMGIVPVLLHIENSGDRSVIVRRERIELVLPDEDASRRTPLIPREVIREQCYSHGRAAWGLPLIVPFVVVYRQVSNFNFALTEDYLAKSLKDFVRVTPRDEPFTRVLYFRVPKSLQGYLERGCSLRVPLEVEALDGPTPRPGGSVTFSIGLE